MEQNPLCWNNITSTPKVTISEDVWKWFFWINNNTFLMTALCIYDFSSSTIQDANQTNILKVFKYLEKWMNSVVMQILICIQ